MLTRTMSGYAQTASQVLTRYRILAGLSQRGLAELAGVPSNSVWQAEHGSVPYAVTQDKIALALSTRLERPVSRFDLWPLVKREEVA